jgi:hypothetical protein
MLVDERLIGTGLRFSNFSPVYQVQQADPASTGVFQR